MPRERRNRTDVCFDAIRSIDLDGMEDQWLLLIRGETVFSHSNEGIVLEYAREHYPDDVPCLLKVPSGHPYCL